jgi:hypothetical protein
MFQKEKAMRLKENDQTGKLSRRKFLGTLGKGAVALAMPNILGVRAAIGAQELQQRRFVIREDRFGRIFPDLSAFAEPSRKLSEALLELGKPRGILDAKDNLGAGPLALIVDPTLNVDNPNNDTHTAGTTFMGQFIDHDMTFDLTSRLGVPTPPEQSLNSRDPSLDLDSVYGGGPSADAELYEPAGRGRHPIKLKVETGGSFEDLPMETCDPTS